MRARDKQIMKTSGADVLSSRKNSEKPQREGGGGEGQPPILLRPRVNVKVEGISSSSPSSFTQG